MENGANKEDIEIMTTGEAGFSLVEMLFTLTITLVVTSLAFGLLAQSLNRKTRDDADASALADANQALSWITQDIMNAGFGLTSNGLTLPDSDEEKIRIRANLNAFLKETTSNVVTDSDEDIIYQLVNGTNGRASLIRSDGAAGNARIISTELDNVDADNDGDGDGLTFLYLDDAGNEVSPPLAIRVAVILRVVLPEIGRPGAPGYQPERTKVLTSTVVLRNSRLMAY
jgi:type II secretory pathway pseudopilin PulG